MADQQATTLEDLKAKYVKSDARSTVKAVFDKSALEARVGSARLSGSASLAAESNLGDHYAQIAEIERDLVRYAGEHGKLEADFENTLGKDAMYTVAESAQIWVYRLIGSQKKADDLVDGALKRKGDRLEFLVNKIAEVLNEQYQVAVEGKSQAERMQVANIAHMKTLDAKIISNLRSSYATERDYFAAAQEIARLESELSEVQSVLENYESRVKDARASGTLDEVTRLTDEMGEILDIKSGILDGRYNAEGIERTIRERILDSAEGLQSANGALAASRVNYKAINVLIDSYAKLVIKFKHVREDMIPVFQTQARISAFGQRAQELVDSLLQVANMSQRLMGANASLVKEVGDAVSKILYMPMYDRAQAAAYEADLESYITRQRENDFEWANMQNTVRSLHQGPQYRSRE